MQRCILHAEFLLQSLCCDLFRLLALLLDFQQLLFESDILLGRCLCLLGHGNTFICDRDRLHFGLQLQLQFLRRLHFRLGTLLRKHQLVPPGCQLLRCGLNCQILADQAFIGILCCLQQQRTRLLMLLGCLLVSLGFSPQ